MKFTRGKRIALELLGPAAIGASFLSLVMAGLSVWEIATKNAEATKALLSWLTGSLFVLLMAYIYVGPQSIVSTWVLERRFKRGLDPASWNVVKLCSALGFVSGGVIGGVIGILGDGKTGLLVGLIFGGLGLVVGFILGLLIRFGSAQEKAP